MTRAIARTRGRAHATTPRPRRRAWHAAIRLCMLVLRLLLPTLLATAALLAPARSDAFCGFYVSGADTRLTNNATSVVMMRDGTRTVLSMQNN